MCLKYREKCEIANRQAERFKKKYDLMYQWMILKQRDVKLIEFFRDRQLKNIAIYGMGDMACLICNELHDDGIIKYGIDRQEQAEQGDIPVYLLENFNQKADAILITPVLITDEIEDAIYDVLGEQTTYTFEEVLFELCRKHGILSELWAI